MLKLVTPGILPIIVDLASELVPTYATGVTSLNTQVGPKRLQLLSELVPGAKSFALLVSPTNPKSFEAMTDDLQVSASR